MDRSGGSTSSVSAAAASIDADQRLSSDDAFFIQDAISDDGSPSPPTKLSGFETGVMSSRESLESVVSNISSVDLHRAAESSPAQAPPRPKTLSVSSGIVSIWKRDRRHPASKTDVSGSSCPTSLKAVQKSPMRKSAPQIKYDTECSFQSLASSWNASTEGPISCLESEAMSSHFMDQEKRSKSRLSLNIPLASGNATRPKSPKVLSHFLRSSWARLWNSKKETEDAEGTSGSEGDFSSLRNSKSAVSFRSSPLATDSDSTPVDWPSPSGAVGTIPTTPSTLAYIRETMESGLPVIPFAYPTCVIVEKLKHKNRSRTISASDHHDQEEETKDEDKVTTPDDIFYFTPNLHSPLESLFDLAHQELSQEEAYFELFDSHSSATAAAAAAAAAAADSAHPGPSGSARCEDAAEHERRNHFMVNDATKSFWSRSPTVPGMAPVAAVNGPYLDMWPRSARSLSTGSRSPAVPINRACSGPADPAKQLLP